MTWLLFYYMWYLKVVFLAKLFYKMIQFYRKFVLAVLLIVGGNCVNAQSYSENDLTNLNSILTNNIENTLNWDLSTPSSLDGVGWVLIEDVYRIQYLSIGYKNISSLSNLDEFTYMTSVNCDGNELAELNLGENSKVAYLSCKENNLNKLVLKAPHLEYLYCYKNKLTSLDLTFCPLLISVDCSWNDLNNIDVSTAIGLETLLCGVNKLTTINVINNVDLFEFFCEHNELTNLNLINNVKLGTLACESNSISHLDITRQTALTRLVCGFNEFTTIDLSKNVILNSIAVTYGKLTSLDISNNLVLKRLYCEHNNLTELDISANVDLTYVNCQFNKMPFYGMASTTRLHSTKIFRQQDTLDIDSIIVLGETIDFTEHTPVNNMDVTFNWINSETGEIETNTTGLFTPTEEGNYYLEMTHPNFKQWYSGQSVPSTIVLRTHETKIIKESIEVGVTTKELEDVYFYPTLVDDKISLKYSGSIRSVKVYNLRGRLELETSASEFSVSNLSHGVYLLSIDLGQKSITKRFIKN